MSQIIVTDEKVPNFSGDFYAILGLTRYASIEEIRRAYRRLAMRYHPDRCSNDIPRDHIYERFKLIKLAYENLIDPKRRSFYDETGIEYISELECEKLAGGRCNDRILDVCKQVCGDSNTNGPEWLASFDVMKAVRESFNADISNAERAVNSIERVILKLKVVLKRLRKKKTTPGQSPVELALNQQLRDARRTLGETKTHIRVALKAKEFAAEYQYEVEPPAPAPTPTVTTFGRYTTTPTRHIQSW